VRSHLGKEDHPDAKGPLGGHEHNWRNKLKQRSHRQKLKGNPSLSSKNLLRGKTQRKQLCPGFQAQQRKPLAGLILLRQKKCKLSQKFITRVKAMNGRS
jgi:hypothetical protein